MAVFCDERVILECSMITMAFLTYLLFYHSVILRQRLKNLAYPLILASKAKQSHCSSIVILNLFQDLLSPCHASWATPVRDDRR